MRNLTFLVRRSLAQHKLSTAITVAAVALACGLVMAVFAISNQTRAAFTGGDTGFDAVLGARGSQLQLVLNTVFHLETSQGNIPWELYKTVRKNPHVALAVPYALGDNYRGFRIVGTTLELFKKTDLYRIAEGKEFFDPRRQEAVIGSYVAQETGLKVGDFINPYHGLIYDDRKKHEERYVIKAILEPTNSPSDRVIWIPIDGIFRMAGHILRGAGEAYTAEQGKEIPDEHKEISAVMLKFVEGSAAAGYMLEQDINRRGKEATLAWPIAKVMLELFGKLGWISEVLKLVAYLVVAVATGTIVASIYNTMNERRREFAILRALGARRTTVFSAIVAESAAISALGAMFGFAAYAVILGATAYVIRLQTGVALDVFAKHPVLLYVPTGMILLGALAGILPAIKAYSTDVADNLVMHS